MAGLFGYIVILEPGFRLIQQSWLWFAGYGFLVVLITCCALAVWRSTDPRLGPARGSSTISDTGGADFADAGTAVVAHEGCQETITPGAGVLGDAGIHPLQPDAGGDILPEHRRLAVSAVVGGFACHLSADIHIRVCPKNSSAAAALAAGARALFLCPGPSDHVCCRSSQSGLASYAVAPAFVQCSGTAFHGELAKGRPAAASLTDFYLCMSIGGVLGGLFNALLAPLLFRGLLEYPLVMCCLLYAAIRQQRSKRTVKDGGRLA